MQNDEEYDIFDEINDEKEQYHSNKNEKIKKEFWRNNVEKKKKLRPALDPFKYNPNYNSIYKNIPSFKIIDPKKVLYNLDVKSKTKKKGKNKDINKSNEEKSLITEDNINLNKKSNSLFKSMELDKTPLQNKKISNTIAIFNNSQKSINKNDLPKLTKLSKYKIVDSNNSDNDNHALRFSKYIPRKFYIHENNKIVSYLDPINYIKPKNKTKSIDFDKMLYRNGKNLIYASALKNPSFGQYNPKYSYIDKNEKVRLFNPDEKEFIKNKRYLMRKLWASYKVNREYQMVDNDKINN